MTAAPMSRRRALFEQALDLPAGERRAFIERECADDADLARDVLQLLDEDADPADAVAGRIVPISRSVLSEPTHHSGQRIGAYRLLDEIGSGGMGTVFLAERADGEFRQRVAIKLIRGFPTRDALDRFKRERELLSQLTHPHIARLLDGGSTEAGQPWLAMEYIEGKTLSQWLDEEHPDLARRLRVFRLICSAVQHAHQHLVIHRDIKPGNILVRHGDDPVLLDFGIGKLLDDSDAARATTAMQPMTPAYASPEQLAGRPTSSASDIFALGLLLYELLAGRPLRDSSAAINSQQSPTRPSDAAKRAPQDWLRLAGNRIRGDLDWITLKALRSEPERRYSSAAALADDIGRFESGRVVEAAPERLSYVAGKWLQRHPVASIATALVLIAAMLFSWQLKQQRDRAVLAERKAVAEADAANEVTQFLLDLFGGADPQFARGRDVSAREMLERGTQELDKKLLDRPLLRARMLLAIGIIYTSLGQPEPSRKALTEAVQLFDGRPPADPLQLARALNELGRLENVLQQHRQAAALLERSLQLREPLLPATHPDIAHSCSALGVAYQGLRRFDEAEANFQRALRIFEQAGPEYQGPVASQLHNFGLLARERRQFDAARGYYQRALAIKRQLYGDQHPLTLNTIEGLASNANVEGDLDEAEHWLRQSHRLRLQISGPVSADAARSFNELANIDQDRGRLVEAERNYRAAIDIDVQLKTTETMSAASTLNNLATLLEDRGDPVAAEALQRRSLAIRIQVQGAEHDSVHRARHNLARQLFSQGRLDEAAAEFALALAGRRKILGKDHPETQDSVLYVALVEQARHPQADIAAIKTALERLRETRGRIDVPVLRGMRAVIDVLPVAERAAALSRLLESAIPVYGPVHPFVAELRLRSAEHWLEVGERDRARNALQGAAAPLRTELLPGAAALTRLQRIEQAL
jgi:tetratricopeptide (TPR) repeat protein/predicted Ser/Thr protein kinase